MQLMLRRSSLCLGKTGGLPYSRCSHYSSLLWHWKIGRRCVACDRCSPPRCYGTWSAAGCPVETPEFVGMRPAKTRGSLYCPCLQTFCRSPRSGLEYLSLRKELSALGSRTWFSPQVNMAERGTSPTVVLLSPHCSQDTYVIEYLWVRLRYPIDRLGEGGEPWTLLSCVYSSQAPGLRQTQGAEQRAKRSNNGH